MIIQHNMLATNTLLSYGKVQTGKAKRMERLSSGYRINRAADDAAGLQISEKMRSQIRGLNRAKQNVEDGISYIQVADGALSDVQGMLHRIRELSIQSANGVNCPDDRAALDAEVQELKAEMDHIFTDTEFNTIKIWNPGTSKTVYRTYESTEPRPAVTMTNSNTTVTLTNTNKGAIPYSGGSSYYTIKVDGLDPSDPDTYGFRIEWEGYDGNQYASKLIGFDKVKSGEAFTANLKDYLDLDNYPSTEGLDFQFGWTSENVATLDDIAASIDGSRYYSSPSTSKSISSIPPLGSGISISVSTNYLAELASGRDVETYDSSWIEPSNAAGNITTLPTYTDVKEDTGWQFSFTMKNGNSTIDVTSTISNCYYQCSTSEPDGEDLWWKWNTRTDGTTYKSTLTHYPDTGSTGSLLAVTDCITDSSQEGDSITANAQYGGTITLNFNLTSNSSFSYGGHNSTSVGAMTMRISVSDSDTEESLMRKLETALTNTTVLDITYTANRTTHRTSTAYLGKRVDVDVPIEVTEVAEVIPIPFTLDIHSGPSAPDQIKIDYDYLRVEKLGMSETNILTEHSSQKAIKEVDTALKKVSAQRGYFGAMQNRLEHTALINANSSENLQASESLIRDADMAKEMMEFSKQNILAQVGESMLSQTRSIPESVLSLLNS